MRGKLPLAASVVCAALFLACEASAETVTAGTYLCSTERAASDMLEAQAAGDARAMVLLVERRGLCLYAPASRPVTVVRSGRDVALVVLVGRRGLQERVWVPSGSLLR